MKKCPTCGVPVKIVYRDNGKADHYEPVSPDDTDFPEIDPETDKKLREKRNGKKTVAIVGVAPMSCSLAPFSDERVEIWALNEMYVCKWLKRSTRWFDIHPADWLKATKRDWHGVPVPGSWETLKKFTIPIYMHERYPDIPTSIKYPLQEVKDKLLSGIYSGDEQITLLSSSFDFMVSVAILEGFERIEIYGFDMSENTEYAEQRPSALFWLGQARGRGIEIYTPPGCQLITSVLYGNEP